MSNTINSDYSHSILSVRNTLTKQSTVTNDISNDEITVTVSSELDKLIQAVKDSVIDDEFYSGKISQLKNDIKQNQYAIDFDQLAQRLLHSKFSTT